MTIVERIREKCKENKTSLSALEKELGFGNGNIRRWEVQKPSYDKVVLVADSLKVSLDWLITGKEAGDLTPEEQQLVDYYRRADDRAQEDILSNARDKSIKYPRPDIDEQLPREQRLSTSSVG